MNIDDWYSMIEIWSLILDDGFWRGYWIVLDDWFIRYNEACIGSHSIEREREMTFIGILSTLQSTLNSGIFSFSRSPTCCFYFLQGFTMDWLNWSELSLGFPSNSLPPEMPVSTSTPCQVAIFWRDQVLGDWNCANMVAPCLTIEKSSIWYNGWRGRKFNIHHSKCQIFQQPLPNFLKCWVILGEFPFLKSITNCIKLFASRAPYGPDIRKNDPKVSNIMSLMATHLNLHLPKAEVVLVAAAADWWSLGYCAPVVDFCLWSHLSPSKKWVSNGV